MPFSLAGFADEGKFLLYQNEELIARLTSSWKKTGQFHSKAVIEVAGQRVERDITIEVDGDGHWTAMTQHAPGTVVEIKRDDSSVSLSARGKDYTFALTKPDSILWENMSPALASHAVLRYDKDKGGKQTLPGFLIPSTVVDISLEFTETV